MQTTLILAADNPLGHVVDKPLFDGVLWHHGDGSTWESIFHGLETIGITKHTVMFLLAGALTLLFFWTYSRSALKSAVPGRWGNFVESILGFLTKELIHPFMGKAGEKFLPLIATFFVYIAICNLLGLIPFFDFLGHGGNTATGSLAVTLGLAICSLCFYHGLGIREQGSVWVYIKSIFPQVPWPIYAIIIPIEIIAHVIRPAALAIRLFANMLAGHTLVAAVIGFTVMFGKLESDLLGGSIAGVSFIAVILLTFLELLVALIQAFVFTFLTTVFLSMAVHPDH